MLRRIQKLIDQPAFRAAPLTVLARGAVWTLMVALKQRPAFRFSAAGERIRVPSDFRYTSITAFLLRDWLEPELRVLDRFVRPGDVMLDVGANIGVYAMKGASLAGPGGRVIAFEPGRAAFEQLEANIALNAYDWVTPIRKAVAAEPGELEMFHLTLGNDPQTFTLLHDPRAKSSETVPVTSLDTVVAEMGLSRVDFVKIDVEGAEPGVLEGAATTLRTLRPKLLIEFNANDNQAGGVAVWKMLTAADYRMFRWDGKTFQVLLERPADFCNVAAAPAEMEAPFGR